jgi:hypothetical protein
MEDDTLVIHHGTTRSGSTSGSIIAVRLQHYCHQ